ncbi:DUF2905 domain-containing protein [Sulfurivirga sp.]|uniref:DUF2905 domain-containing protein n=1 Tax=Sulfurivirga sp. TaxID=2614236 RepID=UPI0025D61168|nr:DUF2905 domain-containing protein [Sulfurivirga sp.]
MGKVIFLVGLALMVIGAVLMWAPGLFGWFGRLPGDIDITSGNTRIFIPLTSMIVVSVALTLLLNLFLRR